MINLSEIPGAPATINGHISVMVLMKRAVLVSGTKTPKEVQYEIDGPPPEELDQTGMAFDKSGKEYPVVIPWTPEKESSGKAEKRGRYIELFVQLAREATGRPRGMIVATRADLYRMALRLVQIIDEHPPRVDWYPARWEAHYGLIKGQDREKGVA